MPPLACISTRQFAHNVSLTFCNKTILPPLCSAMEPDSVTARQMSTTLACGPAAITYMDHVSVF